MTTLYITATDAETGNVRSYEEAKRDIGVAAIIGAVTGGMGGFLKGVEIFANPFADMAIKEVIEGCVATKAGTVLRSLEAIGMPPEERLAYIYDWKTLALDFGLGTLIGIGLGSAGIAFRGAAGEAVERAAKEGMEDALEDTTERAVKEGMEDALEGAGDAAARTVKEGTEGVLEDTTERAAKEGLESGSDALTFSNWDDMKETYKGTITKFIKENKPQYSPDIKKWFDSGGSIEIQNVDGKQIWIYISSTGDSVPYIDGYIKFPDEYLNPTIKFVDIGEFTGDRGSDIDKMMAILEKDYGITEIPEGYVVHHDIKNGILQLVDENIHKVFTHIGGHSIYK